MCEEDSSFKELITILNWMLFIQIMMPILTGFLIITFMMMI